MIREGLDVERLFLLLSKSSRTIASHPTLLVIFLLTYLPLRVI